MIHEGNVKYTGSSDKQYIILSYISKIANEKQVETVLAHLTDMGRDLIDADGCTLWLLDDKKNELWCRVSHGLKEIRIPITHGIAGSVARSGEAEIINDPYSDDRFDREVDKKTGYRTKSIIALPVRNGEDEIIGVYQAVNKKGNEKGFSEEDKELLLVASTYTGKQIESVMLREEIERTLREVTHTLAEAGEQRSKETGQHVKRVSEYSFLLGKLYGMDPKEAVLLKDASPLHDIGKIAVPDSVLLKPGKLTDDEREVMKNHTTLGYEILKGSERKLLKAASVVAYEHHEKWDGTGYPCGTKGEDIHLFGRITAIADVYDALSEERVYKAAWPLDKILVLFKEERGKHFDPTLARLFVENIDKFVEIHETYKD